jgi:hypothetical protein
MDVDIKQDASLTCNMNVLAPAERENHMQSTAQLYQSVQDIRELEHGFEFIFPNESKIITEMAEFISRERLCCPFLEFTIKVSPDDDPISLLLSGPEGTKDFLQAELHEAFA